MRAAQWGGSSYPLVRANKREFVMLKLVWDADAAPPVDEGVKMDEIEEFESDVFERFIHAVERCDEGWRRDDHYRTETLEVIANYDDEDSWPDAIRLVLRLREENRALSENA
jgi:hypothetical protein